MHTPSEAAALWCPMVRIARREPVEVVQADGTLKPSEVAYSVVAGCNRDALGGGNRPHGSDAAPHYVLASCRCIADQCAMWRWLPPTAGHVEQQPRAKLRGPGCPPGAPPVMQMVDVFVPDAATRGYCGLSPLHVVPEVITRVLGPAIAQGGA